MTLEINRQQKKKINRSLCFFVVVVSSHFFIPLIRKVSGFFSYLDFHFVFFSFFVSKEFKIIIIDLLDVCEFFFFFHIFVLSVCVFVVCVWVHKFQIQTNSTKYGFKTFFDSDVNIYSCCWHQCSNVSFFFQYIFPLVHSCFSIVSEFWSTRNKNFCFSTKTKNKTNGKTLKTLSICSWHFFFGRTKTKTKHKICNHSLYEFTEVFFLLQKPCCCFFFFGFQFFRCQSSTKKIGFHLICFTNH